METTQCRTTDELGATCDNSLSLSGMWKQV